MGCRGISALLWHLEHLLPSFFSDLGVCSAVSLTFFLLSPSCCCRAFFYLFLNTYMEMPPASLMGSALASGGSILERAGIDSVRHGCPLTEDILAAPTCTCYQSLEV